MALNGHSSSTKRMMKKDSSSHMSNHKNIEVSIQSVDNGFLITKRDSEDFEVKPIKMVAKTENEAKKIASDFLS